ncbi:VOC family protein [Streptomyces axinellae]|uniref:VOC family protein n=2 Tax=Streptomyces axinellae TaxID=552788 RepID=A0ABP6CDE8_9ACTN
MDQIVGAALSYSARMTIRRIMPNVAAQDIEESRSFYSDFLGMDVRMDEPGFLMLASPDNPTAQMTVVSPAADPWDPHTSQSRLAVEVEDVDAAYTAAERRGYQVVYPLTTEPWGIRRFFVQAPDGSVINVHSHV